MQLLHRPLCLYVRGTMLFQLLCQQQLKKLKR